MHYLLFYEVGEDYVSKRAPFRNQHLEKAWKSSERGELLLAGALANPVDGAVLLFSGDSSEVAEHFAEADPYVTSGAVKHWFVWIERGFLQPMWALYISARFCFPMTPRFA